jgi:hypothetical protein
MFCLHVDVPADSRPTAQSRRKVRVQRQKGKPKSIAAQPAAQPAAKPSAEPAAQPAKKAKKTPTSGYKGVTK